MPLRVPPGFEPEFRLHDVPIAPRALDAALAAGPRLTLDIGALNTFLRTDLFFDGATPFRELRRITPPAEIIGPRDITRDEAIEAYIDLFNAAVNRLRVEPAILGLSGGQDSRHILLALHAAGAVPALLTVDFETSNDLAIAQQLAARVGRPLRVARVTDSLADARYTMRATRYLTTEHIWFAGVAQARDSRPWWDGIGGGLLSSGALLTERKVALFEEGRLDELADHLTNPGPVPYFRDQRLFPRDEAVHAVRMELERHVGAASPVGSFYFWNRTRVSIAASAFGLLSPAGQTTLAPYLDDSVWRFLASLPARMLLPRDFHADTVRRGYPAFADVPFAVKHRRIEPRLRRRGLAYLAAMARRPTRETLAMVPRVVRGLAIPSYLGELNWITTLWAYGDALTARATS